ncbi:MAG: transposase [Oscillospiraceae bacterium]|nr:transposase [Oscillospiraceae bacterium]
MDQALQAMNCQNNLAVWAERVRACRTSGLSVKSWCEENGIVPNTYFRWQKKVFNAMQPDEEQFFEIPVAQRGGESLVSVEVNGMTAKICGGANMETILATLRAMRSC